MGYEQGKHLEVFNRLYREMDHIYHGLAAKAGMSDSAFFILYAIVELGEGCLQKDIAQYSSISRQTINTSIQNLKKLGYLCMEEGKRREKRVYLTEEGERIVREKIYPVMDMEKAAFAEMPSEESWKLLELTEKYVQIFREKTGENL
ncbi:MAG: winged helix-turn-helix transcriptional regulator [Lachnospiraceae bacterium]|jgi:DNA-binding MarR family transcriptional regulator|nr:winged helix-turn-helix transcriptional regulator [Lachnospiraceae bacterium]